MLEYMHRMYESTYKLTSSDQVKVTLNAAESERPAIR